MHARRVRPLVVAVIAIATSVMFAQHASAGGLGGDISGPPVTEDGSNLIGNIGNQVDMLNNGSSGSGGAPAPSCTWTEKGAGEDGEDVERDDGIVRWRLTANSQEFWGDVRDEDIESGTFYRYECWHPDIGDYGEPIHDTWCSNFICFFESISPENLALFAIDGFIETLNPPTPRFNPPNGRTFVNIDTWMWVEDVPAGGNIGPFTMSVPGITVTTTASLDTVRWDMGDGRGPVDCPLTTTEASAEANCTYSYPRSSAGQPESKYHGTASIMWVATWEVAEFPISGEVEAVRSTDFSLAVAEVQTVVSD